MATTSESEGDNDYDYDFVEPPPERLLCRICHLPCRDAQSSENHVYCKQCITGLKIKPSASVDRDVEALKIYCPNKNKNECRWIGEIARVKDHLVRGCEIPCSKCKQIVYFHTMKSHLDTECPCYCPYCDVTAEREVISREHKEKCHKFPLTRTNNINIGVDNVPDKLYKANKYQKEILFVNEVLNSNVLVELKDEIFAMRREAAQSGQIAKEHFEKIDKQTNTMLNQVYKFRSYFTIAVLVIVILIAMILQLNSSLNSLHGRLEEDSNMHILKLTSLLNRLEEHSNIHVLKLNSLQNRLEEDTKMHKQNFIELQQQNTLLQEVLNKTISDLHQLNSSVSLGATKILFSSISSHQVAPLIMKMSSFTKLVMDQKNWYSNPFFAFEEGYQMCLKIHAAGTGKGKGTHVSVYLILIRGPYDDKLEQSGHWPLRGTFTIELLNQLNDSDHYSRIIQFHHYLCSKCTNRVLEGVEANAGKGYPRFISHDTLLHHSNNRYDKNDSLIFRITYEDMEAPYQVAPVTFKLTKFSQWLKNTEYAYRSPPFFAYKGGYQMYLKVHAAYAKGIDAHVSVCLRLMRDSYGDKLLQSSNWPLRGTFTIELLNQFSDSNHYIRIVQFLDHDMNNKIEWCNPQFISHDILLHHNNNSYHKSDSLIFRITYENVEAPYQVAPVTFKLTKFSHWLKSAKDWYKSPSFYAYEGGYKMRLDVYAAGKGTGKGTHVSVYLSVMKGIYDDKLEQSGHRTVRGTFTIELLNQLNDSDHYSRTVEFNANRNVNKQYVDNSVLIEVGDKYISHTILFQDAKGYLQSDTLTFKISNSYKV